MSQIQQIVEGWKNVVFKKDDVEAVARLRMEICDACSYSSKNKPKSEKTIRPDIHCTNCGCPLISKTRCMSCECPIGRWGAVKTEEEDGEKDSPEG